MEKRYSDTIKKSQQFTKYSTIGIVLRVLELIQLVLILAYCFLSHSFQSAIAFAVLLSNVALVFNKRYTYDKKEEVLQGQFDQQTLKPVQTRRFLWLGFLIQNLAFTIFKAVYFISGSIKLSPEMEVALEVQSPVYAFVPCVFLFTTGPLIMLKHRNRPLKEFKEPIGRLPTILLYSLLIILLVVDQFLNVSILGLLLVLIVAGLNAGHRWDFYKKRWLIYITVFYTSGWMLACYICSIDVLGLSGQAASMLGLLAMQQPDISQPTYACFIASIFLTYLLSNLMNRLYSYELIRRKFSDDREEYLLHRQKKVTETEEQVDAEIEDQEIIEDIAQSGRSVDRSQSHDVSRDGADYQRIRADTSRSYASSKEPEAARQIQLSNRIDMAWSHRQRISELDDRKASLEVPLRKGATEPDKQPIQPIQQKEGDKPKQKGKMSQCGEAILKFFQKFNAILVSVHFNFRLMQLVSIILIQRYNTIYSFFVIVWLLLSSIFTRIVFLRWSTLLIVLPATLLNYAPLYYMYIPQSIAPTSCGLPCTALGFSHYWEYIWIDVVIFNYFIYLILTFLKITTREILKQIKRKIRQQKRKKKLAEINPEVSYWKIFVAFVFKYTYLITLIIMFFIGFSQVNLIHAGFSLLFLVFFAVGEQLIVRTIKKDETSIKVITTFSQKNWIFIVNYTGVIISVKYLYFLLFSQYSPEWMDLTGINKTYNTSFNFSLSSYCPSQTTYFFLIYIVAVLQLQICRSTIYKEMSIDVMPFLAQKKFFRERWSTISYLWEIANVFYYQGLFLVSAIVVLISSYQWSINGVIITISVSFGVVYGFGKGRLWVVAMWSNLVFIVINYMLCFLTYPYLQQVIGLQTVHEILYYALRLGFFDIEGPKSNQLLFLNSIIIFWFCVMSSQLYKVLISKYLYPAEQHPQQQRVLTENKSRSHSKDISDKQSSSKFSSVQLNHDVNRNNSKFAETYLKNVILVTCQYYEKDISDYKFIHTIQGVLAFFITDLTLIFVIICCLYFRLSITMAIYLSIYLLHFMLQFRKITKALKQTGYLNNLYQHLKKFDQKEQLMYADTPSPAYPIEQNFEQFQKLINSTKLRVMVLKHEYRQRMWPYAAFLSFFCLISTYTLQLVTQDFCGDTCSPQAYYVQKGLLIIGLSTTSVELLWREIYFYFFMIFISMVERHLIVYSVKQLKKENEKKAPIALVSKIKPQLDYIGEEDEGDEEEDNKLAKPIQQDRQLFESQIIIPLVEVVPPRYSRNLRALRQEQQEVQNEELLNADESLYQQSNLVFFYSFSEAYIKVKSMFGVMSLLLRFYVFLLLINCSVKSNVFSWVYLGIAGFFWVKSIRFEMLEYINRICIVLLLIQYLLLLLNINPNSPCYTPDYAPYTLIGKVLTNQSWLSYLAFGGVPSDNLRSSNANLAFIINSIVVFATEYYFSIFYFITVYTLKTFKSLKNKYAYILQELVATKELKTKLYINYENYKSFGYRFMRKLYETITVHYHIILSLIILLIVLTFQTIVSIFLMILAAVYFCLVIFFRGQQQQRVQKYTYVYFYICKVVTFLELIFLTIFHLPPLLTLCLDAGPQSALRKVCNQVSEMSVTGDLFLLFFVQLWFDMYQSEEYRRFLKEYRRGHKFVHKLMTKCYVYRLNDQKLRDMYKEYQEIINFHNQVESAMTSIEEWHKIMKKEVDSGEYKNEFERLRKLRKTVRLDFAEQDDLLNPVSSLTHKIQRLLSRSMNHTLYQSVPSLVNQLKTYNSRIFGDVKVTCHDYVTENFEFIDARLKDLDQYYANLYIQIEKCKPGEVLEFLNRQITQLPSNIGNNDSMIMPSLLEIKENRPVLGFFETLLYFTVSRFDDLVLLFILMYYMVNPCLASIPIVILILTYEIVADIKRKNWLLIYIVVLIAAIQMVQEYISLSNYDQNKGFVPQTPPIAYSWFFFYDSSDKSTFYSTTYLEFLLVMILINELLKMWVGIGDKQPVQIQNLYQALIRCEINSSAEQISPNMGNAYDSENDDGLSVISSQLDISKNIDKVKKTKVKLIDVNEKDRNPYEVCMEELEDNPKLVLDQNANTGFFKKLRIMRDGIDLYPFIASVQIIIIVYLIIFYQAMQNTNQDLTGITNLNSNKFSAPLILTVLLYVVISVVERWIAIMAYERGYKELIKYCYTMFLLVLVLLEVYVFAPYDRTGVDITYKPTPALIGFMFLQFLYFIISSWQVKWGYKKYKRLNSMLHKRTYINSAVTSVFTAIPFLYELKLIMDWTFCQTGLTLQNWVRHFNIYLISFQSTINSITARQYKLGKPMPSYSKVLFGWCGFLLILLLIFGPMVLFSGLNPVSQTNLVVGGQLEVGIQVQSGNYFELYSTSHFAQPPVIINETYFKQMGFQQVPLLASMSSSQLAQQFQMVNYYPYSDNMWDISTPNFQALTTMINQTLTQYSNNQTLSNQFIISTKYELVRQISDTVSSPTSFEYPFMNGTQMQINKLVLNQQQLQSLYDCLTICGKTATFTDFYISLVRLDTQGNSFKPRPIIKNGTDGMPMYLENISLTINCNKDLDGKTASASSLYWQMTLGNSNQGVVMYVLCDKYTTLSFGFTFVGLYTSIIFVIAGFLRGFFTGNISLIPYNLNPKPEAILCICEAIEVVRMRENLREEVLLFYELVDIMRSPEIIKYMCGNYTKYIKDEDIRKIELEKAKKAKTE